MRTLKALLIEDDPDDALIVREALGEKAEGLPAFDLEWAERMEKGLARLAEGGLDAVLLDLMLPDSRGLETFLRVLAVRPDLAVLVLTGLQDEALALEAVSLGAQDYVVKGTFDARFLKRSILYAIERKKWVGQLEGLLHALPDGMVVVDQEGMVRYVNPAAEALLGREAGELLGRPFAYPVAREETREIRVSRPDGEVRLAELRVSEIEWKKAPASLACLRDLTELRRLEQLKSEVRDHRRLDQMKDAFLANVSNDLKNPLTTAQGAIENLKSAKEAKVPPEQAKLLELADRGIARLARIVQNLLDLSSLETGKTKVRFRLFHPSPFLQDSVERFRRRDFERPVALEADLPQDLPPIYADPDLLEKALHHLLDNACRFAQKKVVVRARVVQSVPLSEEELQKAGERSGVALLSVRKCLQVSVMDDGPGIPHDRMPGLFTRFVQVDRAADPESYRSTGLGLAICREVLHQHRGRIWVESYPGQGARFHFVLPEWGQ